MLETPKEMTPKETGTAVGSAESTAKGTYSVYEGTDPVTGEVKYVGITKRDPLIK